MKMPLLALVALPAMWASVAVSGEADQIVIHQDQAVNIAIIAPSSSKQRVVITQEGAYGVAYTYQRGEINEAYVDQTGLKTSAFVFQSTGAQPGRNIAVVAQSGMVGESSRATTRVSDQATDAGYLSSFQSGNINTVLLTPSRLPTSFFGRQR